MTRGAASGTKGGPAGALPELRQGRPVGADLRGVAVAAVVERGMSAAAAARHLGWERPAFALGYGVSASAERLSM